MRSAFVRALCERLVRTRARYGTIDNFRASSYGFTRLVQIILGSVRHSVAVLLVGLGNSIQYGAIEHRRYRGVTNTSIDWVKITGLFRFYNTST